MPVTLLNDAPSLHHQQQVFLLLNGQKQTWQNIVSKWAKDDFKNRLHKLLEIDGNPVSQKPRLFSVNKTSNNFYSSRLSHPLRLRRRNLPFFYQETILPQRVPSSSSSFCHKMSQKNKTVSHTFYSATPFSTDGERRLPIVVPQFWCLVLDNK